MKLNTAAAVRTHLTITLPILGLSAKYPDSQCVASSRIVYYSKTCSRKPASELHRSATIIAAGKLKTAGRNQGTIIESSSKAFGFLASKERNFCIGREISRCDFIIDSIALLNKGFEVEASAAIFVVAYSKIRYTPFPATKIPLGDASVRGNTKVARPFTDPSKLYSE